MTRAINFRADDGLGAFPIETPYRARAALAIRSALAVDPIVPIPPVVGPYQLILDVSKWNGIMDFLKSLESGARAVWIKANQGIWTDSMFEKNTIAAQDAGIDKGYYHFADPNQTSVSPEQAATHCAGLLKGLDFLSLWLDGERSGSLGPHSLLDYYIRFMDTFFSIIESIREVYTRFSFFNPSVARSSYWKENNIGLDAARYHLGLSSPWSDGRYQPLDWNYRGDRFDKWQYSADGNGLGAHFGASSNSIDLNLFSGTEQDFADYYGLETEPSLEEQVKVLTVKVSTLDMKVRDLEQSDETQDNQIVELKADSVDYETRISDLENQEPTEPPVDPPDSDTVSVMIKEKHKAHYFRDTDDKGKPIMLTDDNDPPGPLKVGEIYQCQNPLALHSRDDKTTPTTIASGGELFYRIIEGDRKGRFIREDKSREVNQ